MTLKKRLIRTLAAACLATGLGGVPAQSALITFQASDFGLTPIFSNVTTFSFSINIQGALVAGQSYVNPALNGVDYNVFGFLGATPSGFPAFNLVRSIGGAEFYSQGSSLSFEIDAGADLSDGLQVSELVGSDPIFEFNGREVGTGRYHPALFQLNADGTGTLQNSNNFGGVNPSSGQVVDVDFGEEYVTALTFDASTTTLAAADAIPEPAMGFALLLSGFLGVVAIRRRR